MTCITIAEYCGIVGLAGDRAGRYRTKLDALLCALQRGMEDIMGFVEMAGHGG